MQYVSEFIQQVGQAISPTYIGTGNGANFDLFMANHLYIPFALALLTLFVARSLWIRQQR